MIAVPPAPRRRRGRRLASAPPHAGAAPRASPRRICSKQHARRRVGQSARRPRPDRRRHPLPTVERSADPSARRRRRRYVRRRQCSATMTAELAAARRRSSRSSPPWPVASAARGAASPAPKSIRDALVRAALDAPNHISYVGQLQTIRWGTRAANATIQRVEHLAPSEHAPHVPRARSAVRRVRHHASARRRPSSIRKQHRAMVSENPSSEPARRRTAASRCSSQQLPRGHRPGRDRRGASRHDGVAREPLHRRAHDAALDRQWDQGRAGAKKPITPTVRSRGARASTRSASPLRSRTTSSRPRSRPVSNRSKTGASPTSSTDLQRVLDEAGFKSVEPRYLPDGFNMIGADVSSFRGVHNLHLRLQRRHPHRSRCSRTTPTAAADFGDAQAVDHALRWPRRGHTSRTGRRRSCPGTKRASRSRWSAISTSKS